MDRGLSWFKHGFQYDVKCNAISPSGNYAKPAITVFAEDRTDAIEIAIKEMKRFGYYNITVDHIVRYK
jgi:hypothetical protein